MKARPAIMLVGILLISFGLISFRQYFYQHNNTSEIEPAAVTASGSIIYYRDPDGPYYSSIPKKNLDGKDFVIVRESEDLRLGIVDNKSPNVSEQKTSNHRISYYRNPMGLPDISMTPKKDNMGMDYVPVYEDETLDNSIVTINPGKLQKSGVRSEVVEEHNILTSIRASGRVVFDPRRTSVVSLRFEGFIESVEKVAEGDFVRKGQTLMRIYGPDLSNAAAEFISVLNSGSRERIEGAHHRLTNLGLNENMIDAIKHSRRVPRIINWPSPQDGHIVERLALAGMRAAPGDTLFRIVDHSIVWVLADVAERDVASVHPGQNVTLHIRSYPDRSFKGKVALIYPHLNMETRTARVRIELANPDGLLLGDMFADVEIENEGRQKVVAVPESAIIDSGKQQVVIIDKGDGRFQPREVKIGRRGSGYAEIESGVVRGDLIVTEANFLIDSESNLKAALRGLVEGSVK